MQLAIFYRIVTKTNHINIKLIQKKYQHYKYKCYLISDMAVDSSVVHK
jgi:hypothetical protein